MHPRRGATAALATVRTPCDPLPALQLCGRRVHPDGQGKASLVTSAECQQVQRIAESGDMTANNGKTNKCAQQGTSGNGSWTRAHVQTMKIHATVLKYGKRWRWCIDNAPWPNPMTSLHAGGKTGNCKCPACPAGRAAQTHLHTVWLATSRWQINPTWKISSRKDHFLVRGKRAMVRIDG